MEILKMKSTSFAIAYVGGVIPFIILGYIWYFNADVGKLGGLGILFIIWIVIPFVYGIIFMGINLYLSKKGDKKLYKK